MVPCATVISEIKIAGFKAVFSGSLKLGPLTLLIGRNGAGKSTAIEAIQFLRDATFRGLAAATGPFANFDELVNRRVDRIELDIRYRHGASSPSVHYTLGVERAAASVAGLSRPLVGYEACVVGGRGRAAQRVIKSRKGKRGPAFRWIGRRHARPLVVRAGDELGLGFAATVGAPGADELENYLSRAVFLRLSPTALALPARTETNAWQPILADDGHDLALLLARLPLAGRNRVVRRVRSIFPDVRGLRVVKRGDARYFAMREHMRSQGGHAVYDIPSWMLSEGMRRIVAIFALLEVEPRPSLIAIEEVENGLDPWTLEQVLDALREASQSIQILLTTHSPFLLDHIAPADVIHVRRARGDTTYEPISSLEAVVKYEGVLAPGSMYLSNLFGDRTAPSSGADGHEED